MSGSGAIISEFILGNMKTESDRLRLASEHLRSAITAQMLREESGRADRFAALISKIAMWNHDMSNALTVAIGYTKMIEKMSSPPVHKPLVNSAAKIYKCLTTISEHVRAMKDLAVNQKETNQQTEAVDVHRVVEAVTDTIRYRFRNTRINVQTKKSLSCAQAAVRGGAVSLRRIFENLITNACEGNGQSGARNVDVMISEKETNIEIHVKDDGPGFSHSQLQKRNVVFESTKPNGTGLGLYTTEQLIIASNGTLARNNHIKGGASVTVALPKADSP
jgi:two-component system, NtrC family, C4-dicarboxylate transport sensor histidine kinase DctB